MRDYTRIYIDGAWVKPLDGKIIDVINPATESPAGQIMLCTAADVDRAVDAARKAFIGFSCSSRQERVDLLSSILGLYAKRQADLADLLTEELGRRRSLQTTPKELVGTCDLARGGGGIDARIARGGDQGRNRRGRRGWPRGGCVRRGARDRGLAAGSGRGLSCHRSALLKEQT